jgi:DNA replication and repair protein RecF
VPLERVRIGSLRCLSQVEVRLHPERNYLYGPNGAGKTSFLEALYLLSRGRSFRTRHNRRLVQRGATRLSVFAESRDAHGPHRTGIEIGAEGLAIKVDQQNAPGLAQLASIVRADVIDPSVHRLIESGPSERRRFLDWGVFHVEHDFLTAWRRYRRVLGQRNAALKNKSPATVLRIWDEALVEAAGPVDAARAAYAGRLRPLAAEVGVQLLGEPIDIAYWPGWRRDTSLDEALGSARPRDTRLGFTQVGPHRADLRLSVGGVPLEERASRGQQKLAAAGLVIAQVHALAGADGVPVLLLDDPAAELDRASLARLLDVLAATPAQMVFTGLSETQLRPEPGFPVFHVEQGDVQEWYNDAV